MIIHEDENCGNCKNWIPDDKQRHDLRLLGECKMSPNCVCCDEKLIFGANGGGTFKCTGEFFCKFFERKDDKTKM